MEEKFAYQSYCWVIGTTSFRTKDFNRSIEEHLSLIHDFWTIPENSEERWERNNKIQEKYYNFLHKNGFIVGNAPNKAKDARQKTSGLCEIGLINNNRRLTAVGIELYEMLRQGEFPRDNVFQIPSDSYIYFRQLLKTSVMVDKSHIRPFVLLIYILTKIQYITLEEFTYLLPLCVNKESTSRILRSISLIRQGKTTIDKVIITHLMTFKNYQEAKKAFLNNVVTENLICNIGMNRKSRSYDKVYYELYKQLHSLFVEHNDAIVPLFKAIECIKIGKLWKNFLFDCRSLRAIEKDPQKHLRKTVFSSIKTEEEFRKVFFITLHLFKAKAMLYDYMDLNRRYFKTSDIILFDGKITIDLVPRQFFKQNIDKVYECIFQECSLLTESCKIKDILPCLEADEKTIIEGLNSELGTSINSIEAAREIVEKERCQRFKEIINNRFTKQTLLSLLQYFEERRDDKIKEIVTQNADVPTIFEYILAIIWYHISQCQGKILDYMNLSLDADLLPKSHAVGGAADIMYKYSQCEHYPTHTLLIEATLTDNSNQRRGEMEPVSRHLGQYLLHGGEVGSYCVFIATYLDINVISDFLSRKTMKYYDPRDSYRYISGMKIIPIDTKVLATILRQDLTYKGLYKIFDEAYHSDLQPHKWYDTIIMCIRELQ